MDNVVSFTSTTKEIRRLAPDLNKAMNKRINQALQIIVEDARGFIPEISPLRNWAQPGQGAGLWASKAFDRNEISRGITKTRAGGTHRTSEGLVTSYAILDKTAAGVIFESSGTKTLGRRPPKSKSTNPNAGAFFIRRIASWSGLAPKKHKMIVRALIKDRPIIVEEIHSAIEETVRIFNNRMDAERAFDPWQLSAGRFGA
ncbi:hypothetical protein UFOVP1260_25 [uncultured Caudovirales phage]|uniref:Uncharacterized protein n=1 Tax=uncultured Caudovirales phage TaxID=2100421 RepID=A0A6J5RR82_9CAUD|nr:hypothetical protein UFOVP1260_25 [uncultured Caudovirales phage]